MQTGRDNAEEHCPGPFAGELLSDLRETATVYQIKNQEDHEK